MRPQAGMRFDQDDIKAYHVLVPHLQRLLRMHYRIAGLETERDAALHALDYLPWGVILIDSYGNWLAANCRAQEILAAREGLMMHGDSVRAVLADESVRLDRLLSSALKGTGDGAGGTLSITRPLKASPLIVVVVPLRSQSEGLLDRAPAVGIFMSDPDVRLDGSEQHLREALRINGGRGPIGHQAVARQVDRRGGRGNGRDGEYHPGVSEADLLQDRGPAPIRADAPPAPGPDGTEPNGQPTRPRTTRRGRVYQVDQAPICPGLEDQGRLAAHQRFRRTLQRHGAGGVLPADHAQPALRERRGAPDRPRRLAAPLQPRAAASRLPQPRLRQIETYSIR